jgi:hypothetical protein
MTSFLSRHAPWIALSIALLAWAAGISTAQARPPVDKRMVGWVEHVHIEAIDTQFEAKLDTGAKTSSIDADVIDIVEYTPRKAGDAAAPEKKAASPLGRIIFTIEDETGAPKTLERDIVRWARIKKKGNAGFIRRPVVHMRFCLAGRLIEDEVNLAVRERFIYPVLIGRNMLEKGGLVVDASRKLTAPATCPKKTGRN